MTDLINSLRGSFRAATPTRLVLLGAGASVEAGIPDSRGLDQILRRDDSLQLYKQVASRVGTGGYPDVERAFRVIEAIAESDPQDTLMHDLGKIGFKSALATAKPAVALAEIAAITRHLRTHLWLESTGLEGAFALLRDSPYEPPENLKYLLPLIRGQQNGTIATLNYDNCLERAHPSAVRAIEPNRRHVLVPAEDPTYARLLKLHGSLDWSRVDDDIIGGAKPHGGLEYTPGIIFGAGNKLRHYGPYLDLYREFKVKLSMARHVITLGFGFNDPHITDALRLWAGERLPGNIDEKKTLTICLGPNSNVIPEPVRSWQTYEHLDVDARTESASEMIKRVFSLAMAP